MQVHHGKPGCARVCPTSGTRDHHESRTSWWQFYVTRTNGAAEKLSTSTLAGSSLRSSIAHTTPCPNNTQATSQGNPFFFATLTMVKHQQLPCNICFLHHQKQVSFRKAQWSWVTIWFARGPLFCKCLPILPTCLLHLVDTRAGAAMCAVFGGLNSWPNLSHCPTLALLSAVRMTIPASSTHTANLKLFLKRCSAPNDGPENADSRNRHVSVEESTCKRTRV